MAPGNSDGIRLGRERGAAMLPEFAIVAPVFFLLLLLVIEVAWQLTVDLALDLGAVAAARYGVTGAGAAAGTRDAAILGTVLAISGGVLRASQLTLSDTSYAGPASYAAGGAGTGGAGTSGQFVVYQLSYVQPFLTGVPASIVGAGAITHVATVLVQNEPF